MDIKKQNIGKRLNLLMRYKEVMDEFNKYDCNLMAISVIHRRFIKPKFHISRDTLYRILKTDIDGELQNLAKTAKGYTLNADS